MTRRVSDRVLPAPSATRMSTLATTCLPALRARVILVRAFLEGLSFTVTIAPFAIAVLTALGL